ncbi:MAG TPA: DUF2059 domain-containing protein [Mucilaginibacter sp.]|jgi:hypothetical protein
MKLKLTLIVLIGVLFLSITHIKAQTDTSKFTPSHLAAARQLILTTGMTDVRFSMMRNNTIKAVSNSVPEKNKAKFISEMTDFMNKYLPSELFRDRFVKMYAEAFSEDELNQLISFYNSPLGKKISSKTPELMQKGMLMDQEILIKHSVELTSIINESVKE